jgi:hypothetical protein
VLFCAPATHIGADLGDELKRRVGPDGINLGQVGPGETMEERADLEPRFVVPSLLLGPRRGQGDGGFVPLGGEAPQEGFDLAVAELDLALEGVVEFEILSQREEVLGAIVAREGCGDLLFGGPTTVITMGGQSSRAGHAGHDVAEDLHAADSRDVADRAFCMRWMCEDAPWMSFSRYRRRARSEAISAVGRKFPRSKPTLCSC